MADLIEVSVKATLLCLTMPELDRQRSNTDALKR